LKRLLPSSEVWIALAIFVLALFFLGRGLQVGGEDENPQFDIDEAHKLAETYYYHLAFERGDLDAPEWTEDFYARTNPPVAKYYFGLALATRGQHQRDQLLQHEFDELWQSPHELRSRVPDQQLRTTRAVSRFFGALVCALMALVAGRVGGATAAVLAPIWLLLNPGFQYAATHGLTDTILLFHLLLIVPVGWSALRALRGFDPFAKHRALTWFRFCARVVFLPALVIALAAGTKLNGAFAGPAYAAGLVLGALLGGGALGRGKRMALVTISIALTALLSVAIFMAINPYFHQEPLQRALGLPEVVSGWMVKQQLSPGGGLFSLQEKIAAAGWMTLLSPELPLPNLAGFLGRLLGVLALWIGVVTLLRVAFEPRPEEDDTQCRRRGDAAVVAGWVAVVGVLVTLWVPVVWARYFLPVALGVGILFGLGFGGLALCVQRRMELMRGTWPPGVRWWRVALAGALLGLAAFGSFRVMDPTLLDPFRVAMPVDRALVDANRRAARENPNSSLRHRRLGNLLFVIGEGKPGVRELELALKALPEDSGKRTIEVQRAVVLQDLTRASARSGAGETWALSLREYLRVVRALRDEVQDPHVRAEFDRVLAERTPSND